MNKLDTKNWKWFKIGDLFEVEKSKNITFETAEESLGNEIPYITRTENNNGVNFFVIKNDFDVEKGNCITIGGEGANVFYQPLDFISGNNITKIYHSELNEDNGLFITSILNLEKYRYSYNRAFNKTCVENTKIKLPIDSYNKPDWKYMENYIKELRKKERENSELIDKYLINEKLNYKLNTTNWKWFKINELFNIKTGKDIIYSDYSKNKDEINNIPIIGHSIENNGVVAYTKKLNDYELMKCENTISLSHIGNFKAFVQAENFYLGTRTKGLILKSKNISKSILNFLCVVINANKEKFSYGRVGSDKIPDLKIALPVDKNNDIDFEYIESFMRERESGIQTPLWSIFKIEEIFNIPSLKNFLQFLMK